MTPTIQQRRFRGVILQILLLSLVCATIGAAEPSTAKGVIPKGSLLLITIDTLRADHLGVYGYFRDTSPNIDALARESILFENAITPMATTLPAHISMFTSTVPRAHGVFSNDYQFSESATLRPLASILRENGWSTAGFVSASPLKRGTGAEIGFDVFDQPGDDAALRRGERLERRAKRTNERVFEWLDTKNSDKPFFLWVHYFDPHEPYDPPAEFDRFRSSDEQKEFFDRLGIPGSEGAHSVNNHYDGEVLYVDSEIERLLARLETMQGYEELAIVLTADHGEGLHQHGWVGHGQIHNEQLFVPLMIKPAASSKLKAQRVPYLVSTIDILPTLLDLLEIPRTPQVRGQIAGEHLLAKNRRVRMFSERVHNEARFGPRRQFALTSLEWKYVANVGGDDMLYNMRSDRTELRNVIETEEAARRTMREELRRIIARLSRETRKTQPVDAELLEELRALGYID